MSNPVRKLTREERFRWGTCPVCSAEHGEPCYADIGFQVGHRVDGRRMKDGEGAHLGRLQRAPFKVQEVPYHGSSE